MAGEENNDWVDSLPEPVREWDEVKNSDGPEKFWDQVNNMRSRLGSSIRIPSEEASDETRQEFFEKLQAVEGVTRIPAGDDPDAWATLYDQLGRPGQPEDYKFDATTEEKAFYHGLGLSEAQAARIVEAQQEHRKTAGEKQANAIKDDYNALMKDWGEAANRKLSGIKHVLQKFDDTGVLGKALEDPDFRYAPEMLRALGNIGDLFLEKAAPGAGGKPSWGITPQEAREQANEMLGNPDSPRNNPNHPNHAAAQEKYMRLRAIATGEARG